MDPCFVEIGAERFVNKFVPGPNPSADDFVAHQKFIESYNNLKRTDKCAFARIVVQSALRLGDDFVIEKPHYPDQSRYRCSEYTPTYAVYPRSKEIETPPNSVDTQTEKHTQIEQDHFLGRMAWNAVSIPIEVLSQDPEGKLDFLRDYAFFQSLYDDEGQCTLKKRITGYMTEILTHQHVLFAFIVVLCKDRARLLRVDRGGIVISKPFECYGQDAHLFSVLYKLSKLTPEQHGADSSVTVASDAEIALMRKHLAVSTGFKKAYIEKDMKTTKRICKITFNDLTLDISGESTRQYAFLVGDLDFAKRVPVGPGTKGYIAFDLLRNQIVYLKDSWRRLQAVTEKKVYDDLGAAGVRNILTVVCGGDVCVARKNQETSANEPKCQVWVHQRIIVEEVARPLEEYKNSRELVKIVLDALLGHHDAWVHAGILHHDINDGNIMIVDTPRGTRGVLHDWDLCVYKSELQYSNTRDGTWYFKSAKELLFPRKPHSLCDDLEGFIHLLNYNAILFHDHKLSNNKRKLSAFIDKVYDECIAEGEFKIGGVQKMKDILAGRPPLHLRKSRTLNALLHDLAILCRDHYQTINFRSMEQRYGIDSPLVDQFIQDRPHHGDDQGPLNNHDAMISLLRRYLKRKWSSNDDIKTMNLIDHSVSAGSAYTDLSRQYSKREEVKNADRKIKAQVSHTVGHRKRKNTDSDNADGRGKRMKTRRE